VVDDVHDTEEIVVKPLGRVLGGIQTYAGATILGDGQIALILDPVVLAREARIEQQEAKAAADNAGGAEKERIAATRHEQQLLIVQISEQMRAAIPLSCVRRLEEFGSEVIERVGGSVVAQYRGAILPLIDVAGVLRLEASDWNGGSVVVVGQGNRVVGLQVRAIIDVSAEVSAEQPVYGRPGISSFGVIQGKVTALLDIDMMIASQMGGEEQAISTESELNSREVEV
jgi:two-component system chemotaxis sensor kinase CheA